MDIQMWKRMMLGMMIADVDGASIAMAEILIQSIIDNEGEYDPVHSLYGYLNWFDQQDIDQQDIVGSTTARVFQRFLDNLSSNQSTRQEQLQVYGDSLFDNAELTHRESKSAMADATVIFRCLPLAFMHTRLSVDQLATVARTECRLTHASKISQQSCAASVLLAAQLLNGKPWLDSVRMAAEHVKFTFTVKNAFEEGIQIKCTYKDLSRGSYCSDVIKASVYFLSNTTSFKEAIEASKKFAYPSNYCPVLVGALAGIIHDVDEHLANLMSQHMSNDVQQLNLVLEKLYEVILKKPKCY